MRDALARLCLERPLDEKWLLAETSAAARQWVTAAARTGVPVVNVRATTLRRLALHAAEPALVARGVRLVPPRVAELLVDRLWTARAAAGGYLARTLRGPRAARTVLRTLEDLRRSGVALGPGTERCFEVPEKGRELGELLGAWLRELGGLGFVDLAEVLALAAAGGALPRPPALVIAPAGLARSALERRVLQGLAPGVLFEVPQPEVPPGASGVALDGRVEVQRAQDEPSEARAALRLLLARGWPLDEVELLHTDSEVYPPLLHSLMQALSGGAEPPVTFADGLPVRGARPGRLVAAWCAWCREGYPPSLLARMVSDGLVRLPDEAGPSFAEVASALRTAGGGGGPGPEATVAVLHGAAEELRARLDGDGAEEAGEEARGRLRRLDAAAATVRALVRATPDASSPEGPRSAPLAAAERLLENCARCPTELDRTAREALLDELRTARRALAAIPDGAPMAFDPWAWLAGLPSSLRVRPAGPAPGCLHVAPWRSGGHSSRPHLFVLGLHEGAVPGAGGQDPLLLDDERRALGDDLPLSVERGAEAERRLASLVAGHPGTVLLSWPVRGLEDDRELFPSALARAAARVLGDGGPPRALAPREGEALDDGEWWACLGCGTSPAPASAAWGPAYPHLAQGLRAEEARAGEELTPWDGDLPPAAELDPRLPEGPILSAHRLERLGRCSLAYFLGDVLGLQPPEDCLASPDAWLAPAEVGTLLHEAFRRFLTDLCARGERPSASLHASLLGGVVDGLVAEWRRLRPPPSEGAFEVQYRLLQQTARIFLREEEVFCRGSAPTWFEVSVGLPPVGAGTPLDCREPCPVPLPGGAAVRLRGRLDRVDRLDRAGAPAFAVWDYKTGGEGKYVGDDPFGGGRVLQHVLYRRMAEARLRAHVGPDATVEAVGYFFPGPAGLGRRVAYAAGLLAGGEELVERLVAVAAAGAYPPTDRADDCRYCDFSRICGDPLAVAAVGLRKLDAPVNAARLAALRGVRRA